MRPRVFPAENISTDREPVHTPPSFNEAAGIPRGKPATSSSRPRSTIGFNEAAGIPRGKRDGDLDTVSEKP